VEPLNQPGDRAGIKLTDKGVVAAPGWAEATRAGRAAGMRCRLRRVRRAGLPLAVHSAVNEIWSASNLAFGLCPLLTLSAIDALHAHGSDELKKTYLPKLISGEWPGTMQLTEPQAGTDVGALRTRAEKQADGTYRLFGAKIFITYGDHDMSDNIVHFILARLPGAPAGTKGITLFLAPKYLVNPDGSLGARNDIYASGIEHKLGIHASPTCTMTMGDKGGAVAYLVGKENGGMAAMFTMMNQARLGSALQGVGLADRAYQRALAYAQERRRARRSARRARDRRHHRLSRREAESDADARPHRRRAHHLLCHRGGHRHLPSRDRSRGARQAAARGALLTPMAKAFSTISATRSPASACRCTRHGLHRGDRRRAIRPRCPHPHHL